MFDKNQKLNRLTLRHAFLLITYTVALVWVILHVNEVLGIAGMVFAMLKPFLYGIMLAFVFHLPMNFFLRKLPDSLGRAKKPLAAVLAILMIVLLAAIIVQIVVPTLVESIVSLANSIPGYLSDAQRYVETMIRNKEIPQEVLDSVDAYALQIQKTLLDIVKNGIPQVLDLAGNVASSLANVFMALVIAVYLTISKEKLLLQLKKFLFAFTSERVNGFLLKVGRLTNVTFSNFVTGQLVEAVIIGVLCYIGCLLLGFPYAPILSVIIGCTNVIPIFGAIFGVGISALLVAFVDFPQGILFVIFGIVLQQIESNLIYPRVVGANVGLSGLWVLFAITIGGGLFSFAGMLLGLPVFSVIYTLLREAMNKRAWRKEQLLTERKKAAEEEAKKKEVKEGEETC